MGSKCSFGYTNSGTGTRFSASYCSNFQERKTKHYHRHPGTQICRQKEVTQVLWKYASNLSIFLEILPKHKKYLYWCISNFKMGCLSQQIFAWKNVTDQGVFQNVQEMTLEFEEGLLQIGSSGFEISNFTGRNFRF